MGEVFKFYDWNKTLSYDAFITIVISERGLGKTYGLRKQCVKDFIKTGEPWAEICRYNNQLDSLSAGYFEKFVENDEFPGYVFKTTKEYMFIAQKPVEGEKPDWRLCGYFLALSNWQNDKKRTFIRPRRIIFDEFLIDRRDRYHRYLPDEYTLLLNDFSTLTRETPEDVAKTRLYMLGNACDLVNPHFEALGIDSPPEKNTYTWFRNKTVMLHYCADKAHAEGMRACTVVGRLMEGMAGAGTMFDSDFESVTGAFVAKRPRRARFDRCLIFGGVRFGVWVDPVQFFYYVTQDVPKGGFTPWALTKDDGTINRTMVKRADPYLQAICELHYSNAVRYESDTVREKFFDVLKWLGVR